MPIMYSLEGAPPAEAVTVFLERVSPEPNSGCWLWDGGVNSKGYGFFYPEPGRFVRAHRFSYRAFNGPLVRDKFICHRCDVPLCVNPQHLFIGTNQENLADMRRKGRQFCKIPASDHRQIKLDFSLGVRVVHIAEKYGTNRGAIYHILHKS